MIVNLFLAHKIQESFQTPNYLVEAWLAFSDLCGINLHFRHEVEGHSDVKVARPIEEGPNGLRPLNEIGKRQLAGVKVVF